MTIRTRVIAAAASTMLLAACTPTTLEDTDPAGHAACTAFLTETHETGDPVRIIGGALLEAGETIPDSTTPEIRAATVDGLDVPGITMADGHKLRPACEDHGYRAAEHSAAWWQEQV